MIARTWTGTVHRADADEYAEYITATGFAEYGHTPGNLGAWLLRHDDGDRTEFITCRCGTRSTPSAPSPATTSTPRSSTRRMRATSSANRRSPTTRGTVA